MYSVDENIDRLRKRNKKNSRCFHKRRQEEMAYRARTAIIAALRMAGSGSVAGCSHGSIVKVRCLHDAYRHEG